MPQDLPEPSTEACLGACIEGDGRVRFTLYAPGKRSVHLVGSFNDWDREAEPLEARDDGTWTAVRDLPPGEHAYRFLVDDDRLISDPYARAVRFGGEMREGERPPESVVRVGGEAFAWRHEQWRRPPFQDLVFYEVALADFVPDAPGQRLRGLIDRLDHLQSLGINAVEPLPITAFASRSGWGYDPTHLFAVHPDHGTSEDMKALVDACHGRGMAVVLDIVLAHTGQAHPFTALYPLSESPWYGERLTKEEQEFGMPALDYGKPGARRFAADVLRWWLQEYRVDGFRFDYLKLIGVCGREAVDMLCDAAREVREDAYLVGEHLPEDPKEINRSRLSGTWHLRAGRMLRALLIGEEVDGFEPDDLGRCLSALDPHDQGYRHGSEMVNYVDSHDEDRVVRELCENGDDADLARRKLALAWTLLATAPGEPMIYAGQEWGEDSELDKEKQSAPLDWSRLDDEAGRGLCEHHRRMVRLRHDHPATRTSNFKLLHVDDERRVATIHRWNDEGDEVAVCPNFSGEAVDASLVLPRGGAWREVFTDSRHEVDDGEAPKLRWRLEPWSAAVFVRG